MLPHLRRPATALSALLTAVLVASLLTVGAPPAQATATLPTSAIAGYARVIDPYVYVATLTPDPGPNADMVIHVDTEHADAEGFWYARNKLYKSGPKNARDFQWFYQPWGGRCDVRGFRPEFSPWMNIWTCMPSEELVLLTNKGKEAVEECAALRSTQPWMRPALFVPGAFVQARCTGIEMLAPQAADTSGLLPTTPAAPMTCAPWEAVDCLDQTYPWAESMQDVRSSMWRPAPDTCTGFPADANKPGTTLAAREDPADPSCSGEELAANCPVGSQHAACSATGAREQGAENPAFGWLYEYGSTSAMVHLGHTASGTGSYTATREASKVSGQAYGTWRGRKIRATRTVRQVVVEPHTVTLDFTNEYNVRFITSFGAVGRSQADLAAHRASTGAVVVKHSATSSYVNLQNQAFHAAVAGAKRNAELTAMSKALKAVKRAPNAAEKKTAEAKAVQEAKEHLGYVKRWLDEERANVAKTKKKVAAAKKKLAKARGAKARSKARAALARAEAAYALAQRRQKGLQKDFYV